MRTNRASQTKQNSCQGSKRKACAFVFSPENKEEKRQNKGKQEIKMETAKEAVPGKILRPSIQFSSWHSQGQSRQPYQPGSHAG
jgi:hypothetical protein